VHVFKQNWHILAGFWHIGRILSDYFHHFPDYFAPENL